MELFPGAAAQHIVIAIYAVDTGYEGVLSGQLPQQLGGVAVGPEIPRLLGGKIIGYAEEHEKIPLTRRQRREKDLVDKGIDIRCVFRPASGLGKGAQMKIDHREPAFRAF